jgi:nucleoside-diphosphate-sugar epimerase
VTRILVTGANGFVGRALVPVLEAAGHTVIRAIRRADGDSTGTVRAAPELGPNGDWRALLEDVGAVVHLAARVHVMRDRAIDPLATFRRINVEGTRRLAEDAAAAGVGRLLFVSSVKVMGETDLGRPFNEDDPPQPADAYGQSKREAEHAVLDVAARSRLEAVVLRPPLVYGPGVKGNFAALLGACHRGWPLPLGAVDNRRSLLYVGNLTDAIATAVTHPAAAGRTYFVRDGEDLSTAELARRTATALGRRARLLPVPPALLAFAGRLLGRDAAVRRLLGSLRIDDTRLRNQLDWHPPFTVQQGLANTAEWYARTGDNR